MLFTSVKDIKRKDTLRKQVQAERLDPGSLKEIIEGPYFFSICVLDKGVACLRVERPDLFIRFENAEHFSGEDINKIMANAVLHACEVNLNFFEAKSDEVEASPKDFKVSYSKIKGKNKGQFLAPEFKVARCKLPETFEAFKNLVKHSLTKDFALLRKYKSHIDPDKFMDIKNRMLALDKQLKADLNDKKIWDVFYLQSFPTIDKKDSDLLV